MSLSDDIDPQALPEPYKTRVSVWRQTKWMCARLPPPAHATVKVLHDPAFAWSAGARAPTAVSVVVQDTLDAAQQLVSAGAKVAMLNMACEGIPLGDVATGSGCQEESIARRTTLCQHLHIKLYPLEDTAALYSQDVVCFRSSEQAGFQTIKPFKLDVVSCAAVRCPKTVDGNMNDQDASRMRNKIQLIFQAAYKHGADSLVLSAFGCGAYRCPSRHVAELFKGVCSQYDGMFRQVTFAVLAPTPAMFWTKQAASGNCADAFLSVFECGKGQTQGHHHTWGSAHTRASTSSPS